MREIAIVPARPHPFPLAIERAALLVIDMQNDFCHPQGYCLGTLGLDPAPISQIVPKIEAMIAWARSVGVPVAYTRESHRPDLSDLAPAKKLRYENAGYPVGALGAMGRYLVRGEPGCQVLDELAPAPGELAIDKPAQSAFIGTELEQELRRREISHLLVAGVTTPCCVLATYRDAGDLGFFALLLEDCCAAFDRAAHQAAIDVLLSEDGALGWVGSSNDIIQAVPGSRS